MKLMSRIRSFTRESSILALMLASFESHGQEIIYYGEEPKTVDVFAGGESLMIFPSPPFARVCQPSGVVDMEPVADAKELERHLVPRGIHYQDLDLSKAASSAIKEEDRLSYVLKLVPKRKKGAGHCSITLANNDIVNLVFRLSDKVFRPIIPLRSIYDKTAKDGRITDLLDAGDVFKSALRGGKPDFLADVTPHSEKGKRLTKYTKTASYVLAYVGTDKLNYKLWTIHGRTYRTVKSPFLNGVGVNRIYYSSYRPIDEAKGGMPVKTFLPKKDQKFQLHILSVPDLDYERVWEMLP